jgi:hypothetical protein
MHTALDLDKAVHTEGARRAVPGIDGIRDSLGPSVFASATQSRPMPTTITREMEDTNVDTPIDAKDDLDVDRSDSNEGEKIEILGITQTTEQEEKNNDKDDNNGDDEGDRHVILTPSRRIRISSLIW